MEQPVQQETNLNPDDVIETTVGKISCVQLFRVAGVDMAWMESESQARDVARRVRNFWANRQ